MNHGVHLREDIENLLSVKNQNTILKENDKELKLEKFNGQGEPSTHLQGFEYTMELKISINNNLKTK